MKSSRRIDGDNARRDSRDREVSHTSGSRFGRKRPSMLSEFHGSKHYSHRDGERESTQHYRSHNRYSHDSSGAVASLLDHTHTTGFHSKSKQPDSSSSSSSSSRSRHSSRHHSNPSRPSSSSSSSSSSHHHSSNSYHHTNSSEPLEDETPVKRPRLMVDISRKASLGHGDSTTPSSANLAMVNSNSGGNTGGAGMGSPGPPWPSGAGGLLPYHLEDIDSDDDSLLQEDSGKKLSKSPTPVPIDSPTPSSPPASPHPPTGGGKLLTSKEESRSSVGGPPMPSKEELLMMMEKVDRDIATAETQISALEKKRVELEESARAAASTPHSSTFSSAPSPITPTLDHASPTVTHSNAEDTPLPSPPPSTHSPKKSLMDIIYSDNRIKSKSAHNSLSSISFSLLPGSTALYHQPSEAPLYYHNLHSHQQFRPTLIQFIRRRKLEKHKRELQLCEEYDALMNKWEKSVERVETNLKKKLRDQKNRELFERHFPELKAKREHQERMTRVDQRGYSIVRSDAELKEIMYELCEQEEGPVRNRKTHALIPPMLIQQCDKRVKFFNENGLISDPMAFHRDSRFVNVWSEEEKSIFRDKYMFYPKNFEMIASFLPNKTPSDCIQYYYLSKKRENFKHLVRKANLKRKKPFVKPSDFSNPQLSPSIPPLPMSLFASSKPGPDDALSVDEEATPLPPEFGDWSSEEISCLKEGLRKYGRAWGKIYREVGGLKTATQCKQFYDKHYTNKELELTAALEEHSFLKNAEKMRRKESLSRKPMGSGVMTEGGGGKKKALKGVAKPSPPLLEPEDIDSENTASASETESNSDESTSETTITDSSPEDGPSNSAFVEPATTLASSVAATTATLSSAAAAPSSSSSSASKISRGKKPKLLSSGGFRRTSEEALDLFISAAEALNNIVPPEVALHDHTYAQPPSSLVNNMELQGTSGLSLIAAAAAVVSPTLSKSAASTKLPSLSPVRAPRGRPPNSQRKGTNGTASKLAPTLLSPAGTSPSVLLTEMKAAPLRGRARSAPSDRPKISTLHVSSSRPSSTLARMSINSSSRSIGRGGTVSSSSPSSSSSSSSAGAGGSFSRHKGDAASKGASSLKSMIASSSSSSSSSSSTATPAATSTTTNSTSAFEALVNVAVAAPPAELPHSGFPHHHTNSHASSSSSSSSSSPSTTTTAAAFTATPLSRSSQPAKDTITIGIAGANNSNASNSATTTTTTAYIDVNQAINILATLAQQQVSSGAGGAVNGGGGASQSIVLPNSRLLTQNSVNLLGNIVSTQHGGKAGLISTTLPPTSSSSSSSSKGHNAGSKGLSVSTTFDTLLGHLTSGIGAQMPSVAKNTAKSVGGNSNSKPKGVKSESKVGGAGKSGGGGGGGGAKFATAATSLGGAVTQPIQLIGNIDDLSNLNLLSSLVAAVAATQSTATTPTTPTTGHQATPQMDAGATLASAVGLKSSMGQPSSLHNSKTEVKRPLESIVSALANASRNSSPSSLAESTASSPSHVSGQSHAPTPAGDGHAIAASSSIKKASSQNSSSLGAIYGGGGVSTSTAVSTANELPRSVVRSGLGGVGAESLPSSQGNSVAAHSEGDMTASLASIIPPYNSSSMNSQSLLLYTRSLSFPLSVPPEPTPEEEDHLESATRGISELSKLLGTDTTAESSSSPKHDRTAVYKGISNWNPAELLSNSAAAMSKNACNSDFTAGGLSSSSSSSSSSSDKATGGGKQPYHLSSLLESQIHGTVHHASLGGAAAKLGGSATTGASGRGEGSMEAAVDVDHSR